MRFQIVFLLGAILLGGCKLKPIDDVYVGYWENTFTETYHYVTHSTTSSSIQDYKNQGSRSPVMFLSNNSLYYHFDLNGNNDITKTTNGKWSIRNTNDITIQSDESLFHGKIVLLNDVLHMDGISYPIDSNNKAIQAKGTKITSEYRRLANPEYQEIEGAVFR